jgi:hypothetical protein
MKDLVFELTWNKVGERVNIGLNLSASSMVKNDSDGDGNMGVSLRQVAPM